MARMAQLARMEAEVCAEARASLAAHDAFASDPSPDDWPTEPAQAGEQSWILRDKEPGRWRERLALLSDKKAQLGRELDRITTARLRGEPTPEGEAGSVAVQFRRDRVKIG